MGDPSTFQREGSVSADKLNPIHAKYALERLALSYGVTQLVLLELLIVQAERVALQQAVKVSWHGDSAYFVEALMHTPMERFLGLIDKAPGTFAIIQ